jgi:hypothetical protein
MSHARACHWTSQGPLGNPNRFLGMQKAGRSSEQPVSNDVARAVIIPPHRWISRGRDKRREPAQKEEPRDGGRRGLSLSEFSVPGKDAIHLAFAGSNFFNC